MTVKKQEPFSMRENDKRVVDRFTELALVDGESFNERLVADYLIAEFQRLGIKLIEDDIAGKIGGNCGNLYGFAEGGESMQTLSLFCSVHIWTPYLRGTIRRSY